MTTTSPDGAPSAIDLPVGGMTCAGCAATIQRGLASLPGVDSAAVNVATRRATVLPDGTLDADELEDAMRAAIAGLGYEVLGGPRDVGAGPDGAHRPDGLDALAAEHAAQAEADARRVADYRRRLLLAAALAVPLAIRAPGPR